MSRSCLLAFRPCAWLGALGLGVLCAMPAGSAADSAFPFESTITIRTGRTTDRQCDPARRRGDDELLATLQQVNSWRREGDVLMLRGGKSLHFRQATN